MNITAVTSIQRLLVKLEDKIIVPRAEVERTVWVNERVICKAFFSITNEVLVKVDPSFKPSIVSKVPHEFYMLAKNLSTQNKRIYDNFLSKWSEGIMRSVIHIRQAL